MTDFEIKKIKEHIQIHTSKEPQARLITDRIIPSNTFGVR